MIRKLLSIFFTFLKLGCLAFGGPTAHIGFFQQVFVTQKRWCSSEEYAQIVALCQILPGPASSQVGIALGYLRAGYWGSFMAWLGFTLPAATIMILLGLGVLEYADSIPFDFLKGLQLAAIAVVAQAVWMMGVKVCADRARFTIMILATCLTLILPSFWTQVLILLTGALFGLCFLSSTQPTQIVNPVPINLTKTALWIILFCGLLFGLPFLRNVTGVPVLTVLDIFYRAGSLVFGGGHLVLPLLQNDLVATGLTQQTTFLAGYGMAQAIPGPMFSLAGYLGASLSESGTPLVLAVLSIVSIFLPSFFLVFATLPLWHRMQQYPLVQNASQGMQSAVVGLLLATLYHPLWIDTVVKTHDVVLILIAFLALHVWKVAPWIVVLGAGLVYGAF